MVPSLSQQLQLQYRRQRQRGQAGAAWRVDDALPVSLQCLAAVAPPVAEQPPAAIAALPSPVAAAVVGAAAAASIAPSAATQEPELPAPQQAVTPPGSEAIALLVWLLLVLIDGGLSLRRLWRRRRSGPVGPALTPAMAGAAAFTAGKPRVLLRLMAPDQPAVAIS